MDLMPKVRNAWTLPGDTTMSISTPYAGVSRFRVNQGASYTWTNTHQFNSTQYNYGTLYNYGTHYHYGAIYLYGTTGTNFTAGSIPFINASQQLTYDASDFYRDNSAKRYGFGIGNGSTLEAKVHIRGTTTCTGTASACSSFGDSTACTNQSGCSWTSYGSCYSYSDESSCNAQQGCAWNSGTSCSGFGDEMTCTSYSGCSWDGTPNSCSEFGDQTTCESYSGCTWDSGMSTCSGEYYTYACNGTYGAGCEESYYCTGDASPCSAFTSSEEVCEAQGGCTWDLEPALKTEGKVSMITLPTSSSGLSTGDLWNDSGTIKIV